LQLVTYLPIHHTETLKVSKGGFHHDATEESFLGCPNNLKVTFF